MIASWRADHLRVSLFSGVLWNAEPASVLADAFGVQPESTSQKATVGESNAVGRWASLRVEVRRTINRFDFILQPIPDLQQDGHVPSMSGLEELFPRFTSAVGRWITGQSQEVIRVAVGCGGLLATDDVAQTYLKLKQLVKVVEIDADRFRDMQFQVNLPVHAKTDPDLLLNRITSWTSIRVEAKLIGPAAEQALAPSHFVTCTIDINTDAARTAPFEMRVVGDLLAEMCQGAIEVLDNGIE